jgi:glycosyltransferase involved in cell wall biosynthesis
MISLLMPTYNREATLPRAIESVLGQTYDDWELVIVDDGSTDGTEALLAKYTDLRIRYVKQPKNMGVTAARNRALDEARGEWVGMFDSDDELVPQALSTLMRALDDVDRDLDAISCNCFDSRTGKLAGYGLSKDQWLNVPLSLEKARGEHWGIFRRKLIGSRRFDPRIKGYEGLVWNRIHDGARWYYLHRGLRIYHTEGQDRLTTSRRADQERYRAIIDYDPEYLTLLRGWSRRAYRRFMWVAATQFILARDDEYALRVIRMLDRERDLRVALEALRLGWRVTGPFANRLI